MIIAGFAGVGKTQAAKALPNVVDLESMDFQYADEHPDLPDKDARKGMAGREIIEGWQANYAAEAIRLHLDGKIVLIAPPPSVLSEITRQGYHFTVVLPDEETFLNEYAERYAARGNSPAFFYRVLPFYRDLRERCTLPEQYPTYSNPCYIGAGQYMTDAIKSLTGQ